MKWEKMKPLVSVVCITYNHEKFISQAINSFLMQKTDFPIEIVIGEDCSTDRTREICLQYQQEFPNIINLITSEKNVGMKENFVRTFESAKGKYIALCDGDDYWIDDRKLQLQVDFLEKNQDYSICFHATRLVNEKGEELVVLPVEDQKKTTYSLEDLIIKLNFMATCSVLFRNHLFKNFPDWYYKLEIADHPLHVFNAQHGLIGYIDIIMSVYRSSSCPTAFVSRNPINRINEEIRCISFINEYLNFKFKGQLEKHLLSREMELFRIFKNQKNWFDVLERVKKIIKLKHSITQKSYFLIIIKIIFKNIKKQYNKYFQNSIHGFEKFKFQTPIILGRTACLGKDVLNETKFKYFPLNNLQKARADVFVNSITNSINLDLEEIKKHMLRQDVFPLIQEQSQMNWVRNKVRNPAFILIDSFAELTDQKFSHKSKNYSFCCHYNDLIHSGDFKDIYNSDGLLDINQFEEYYFLMFSEIRKKYRTQKIVFMHYSAKFDDRIIFKERRKEISRVIQEYAKIDPDFINIDLDDEMYYPHENDKFPYHYNKKTHEHIVEKWKMSGFYI